MTIETVKATAARLEQELADVDRELTNLYETLTAQAGDMHSDPKEGERIAARIVGLEARRKTIEARKKQNDKEAERLEAFVRSKEYKAGVKALAEAETFAASEVQEVKKILEALRARVTAAMERSQEYRGQVERYGLELTAAQRMRKRSNKDFAYLAALYMLLENRAYTERQIAGAQQMTEEITDPAKRAAMDRQRAARAAAAAKQKPLVMPEQKPIPPDPSAFVAPRGGYTEPRYPDQ